MLLRKNHTCQTDHFALGVILYELVMGKRPYSAKDRRDMREKVIAKQARISRKHKPLIEISKECKDIINQLIKRRVHERLGANGNLVNPLFSHF